MSGIIKQFDEAIDGNWYICRMDIVEAISQCRYYRGEEECPYTGATKLRIYWDLERVYCGHRGELDKLNDEYYIAIGGKDFTGMPRALLITLFGAWCKGAYDAKGSLPAFYDFVDYYLKVPAD